jgi:hypothetical protein
MNPRNGMSGLSGGPPPTVDFSARLVEVPAAADIKLASILLLAACF